MGGREGVDNFSRESIEVIQNFLHGVDRGNSHFSVRIFYMIVYASTGSCSLLAHAAITNVHNDQPARVIPTGAIVLRVLHRHILVQHRKAHQSI